MRRRGDPAEESDLPGLKSSTQWHLATLWLMDAREDLEDPAVWEDKMVISCTSKSNYARLRKDAYYLSPIQMTLQDTLLDKVDPIVTPLTPAICLFRADLT